MRRSSAERFWLVAAAAVLGICATLALGAWQLSRGNQKLELHSQIERRGQAVALDGFALATARKPLDLLHFPVVLHGAWLQERTVFLENRQMSGKQGFYVVTPLREEASDAVVLVQRGWVQRDFNDRARLPRIDTPPGRVEIRGRIAPPPAKLYEFGTAGTGPIRQNLDLAEFRRETGLPLLEVSVQQTGAASEGLQRAWPTVGTGADKNFGYAFQWWALSGLIAILYVWFQFFPRRPKSAS